jgi:hypothetical protein
MLQRKVGRCRVTVEVESGLRSRTVGAPPSPTAHPDASVVD